jgi:hypothetical protein
MEAKKRQKLKELKEKLKIYEGKLTQEMRGYRGVIHESASSEIKHDRVMVIKAMIESLQVEIANLEKLTT